MKPKLDDPRLSAYLDGRLPPRQMRRLKTWLECRPDATYQFDCLCHIVRCVRGLRERDVAPPSDFWTQAFAQLREQAQSQPAGPDCQVLVLRALQVVAVLLAVAGVVSLGQGVMSRHTATEDNLASLREQYAAQTITVSGLDSEHVATMATASQVTQRNRQARPAQPVSHQLPQGQPAPSQP